MPAVKLMNAKLLAEQKPLGVIDVLTAGFEIVRKRPWTILIPILADALIWLLPRLSLSALFRPVIDEMFPTSGLPPDLVDNAKQMHDTAVQVFGSLNLLGVVSAALDSIARLPSLLSFENGDIHSPITALAYTFQLQSGLLALFLFIPLFLLGLFAAAVYVELIALGVRPLQTEPPLAWLPRTALLWLRLIVFSLALGFLVLASTAILMLAQTLTPFGADASSFVAALIAVGWFWLTIYLFFVIAAMAVSNLGLFDAIRRSILIFRLHFWASLALIALTLFLDQGLKLVWTGLLAPDFDLGILFAIIANAIIGTGLLAAAMIFYQDRMNYTERLIARARTARR
jgi:hypothetical protein